MNCPNAREWDLLAMEALDEQAVEPLLAHLKQCPDCPATYERARRAHLERIRTYDQLDRGHDGLREQLLAALPAEPARSRADRFVRGWQHTGDFAMFIKHRVSAKAAIALVSVAACIVFAVALTSFAGGRNAFAAAIEQFQKAKTIVCRVSTTVEIGGTTTHTFGKLYISAEYGSRMETSMNGMTMLISFAPLQGPQTMINPLSRSYTVVDKQVTDPARKSDNNPDGFILALVKLKGQASRELGRANLEGIDALGYEISGELLGLGHGEGIRSELWVDAKTYLPVRYVAEIPIPQAGSTCELVFDQFEWDTPVDASLFTPDIPAGYTRIDATMPPIDEAVLIKGLGNYVELVGKYPSTMEASTLVTEMSAASAHASPARWRRARRHRTKRCSCGNRWRSARPSRSTRSSARKGIRPSTTARR